MRSNIKSNGIDNAGSSLRNNVVHLVQFETERLLGDDDVWSLRTQRITCVPFEEERGQRLIPQERTGYRIQSFMSVFCNEAIIIPDCLMETLTENSEFDRDAVEMREYIGRPMC